MKRIKILFSAPHVSSITDTQVFDGPEVQPDFSRLETHYKRMRPAVLEYVEQTKRYWHTEGEQRLFSPKARIVLMTREEAEKHCSPPPLEGSFEFVVALTWTIGDILEAESVEWMQKKESLKGLLLDVTGSLCLYAMHSALIDWVGARSLELTGLPVVEEFYPSLDTCSPEIIKKMQEYAQTERYIGVQLHAGSMLYPKKSQCAFMMVGKGTALKRGKNAPCNPCQSFRCLYWQLGGCHADVCV